uniref:Venom protein n=1 Tax=Hadrurus spadix TaxID=141984 RepID=A0A1W7R939_9SCOR
MKCSLTACLVTAACVGLSLAAASGNPIYRLYLPAAENGGKIIRRSGVSDQRLAELETMLALSKFRTQPSIILDLEDIGKRKRSINSADERIYPADFDVGKYNHKLQSSLSDFLTTIRRRRNSH